MVELKGDEHILAGRFEAAYKEYLHKLEFFANGFLQDIEHSKGVVQNVYLKIWDKRGDIDWNKDVFPLLLTMTKNECLNILKRNQLKLQHGNWLKYAENQFLINTLTRQDQVDIYGKEVQALISKAVDAMPPKVRSTFLLSRNENLKNKEIAQIQGIGLSTVEYRLSCAFKILRKHLKDYIHFLLWLLPHCL